MSARIPGFSRPQLLLPANQSRIAGFSSVLLALAILTGPTGQASAAQKKHVAPPATQAGASADAGADKPEAGTTNEPKPAEEKAAGEKPALDFDFFGGQAGGPATPNPTVDPAAAEIEGKSQTRRWMLKVHQTLGITTWALMVGTVVVGQLNYNQLWGGGGGSTKWQTPHRVLVLSTSILFTTTATFSIFAPKPYDKPLRLDTGLVHRIAAIGATLGMVSEAVLGWITTHQANAGNPHSRTMARTHQIIGYSTLGFLTVAGTVWVF